MAPPGLGFGVGLVAVSFQHSLFVCLFFPLCLPFGFSSYIVHLRCTSEGWWSRYFTRPLILSFFVSVFCPAVLLSAQVGCIVYTDYVYPAFVTLLADVYCLLFIFRKCLLLLSLFCFPSLLFHHTSFVFISGLLAIW